MNFSCLRCAACCRLAGILVEELDRGDGVCKHLSDNNLCNIYESRPYYCVVKQDVSEKIMTQACDIVRKIYMGYQTNIGTVAGPDARKADDGRSSGPVKDSGGN